MFLLQRNRPEKIDIVSPNNGKDLTIKLNQWTGRFYLNFKRWKGAVAFYIGNVDSDHYFFNSITNRIFSLKWITDEDMKDL
jgi:hypothetical protein